MPSNPLDVLAEIDAQLGDDPDEAPEHRFMSPAVHQGPLPKRQHNTDAYFKRGLIAKAAGNTGSAIASYTVAGAQLATGAPGIGAVALGAAVTGAGPIGLLVASLALSLGFSVQAGVSADKTRRHIKELDEILANGRKYPCSNNAGLDHNHVLNIGLPYIIGKKRKKLARKAFSAVPFMVSLESARSAAKAVLKKEKGKTRNYYAQVLARHHCSGDCALTAAIIKSLFWIDDDTVEDLRDCSSEDVASVLSTKMKSV